MRQLVFGFIVFAANTILSGARWIYLLSILDIYFVSNNILYYLYLYSPSMFFLQGKYHRTGETELRERRWGGGDLLEKAIESICIVKVNMKKGYKNIGSMNLFI